MQPALKTRLIGAAVLVALAVIVVPLFFSGEPGGTGSQSISLDIPQTPDKELETRTMSVAPPAQGEQAGQAEPAGQDMQDASDGDALARVDIPSRGSGEVTPAGGDQPDAASASAATATPSETTPAERKADDKKQAEKKPADTAKPTPAEAAKSQPGKAAKAGYQVSLGAYASKSNAEKLMASVRKQGYPVSLTGVTISGKSAARVDAGPFDSRAAAEAARLKLHAALPHVPARLVAVTSDQSKDAPAENTKAAPRNGGWAVQLVAYSKKSDATALRDKLRGAGFDGYVDSVKSGGSTLWRVRAGPQARRADAVSLQGRIKQKFPDLAGRIVTVP